MKGDDRRAEQLAVFLDGGACADEIEPLVPAARRVAELLDGLAPGPSRATELTASLLEKLAGRAAQPAIELAHVTVYVGDMDAALSFYRDGLGLIPHNEGGSLVELDAGGVGIALHSANDPARPPGLTEMRLKFRTDNLNRAVDALRQRGVQVTVKTGESGRYAELRDPDGRTVWLLDPAVTAKRLKRSVAQAARSARTKPRQ